MHHDSHQFGNERPVIYRYDSTCVIRQKWEIMTHEMNEMNPIPYYSDAEDYAYSTRPIPTKHLGRLRAPSILWLKSLLVCLRISKARDIRRDIKPKVISRPLDASPSRASVARLPRAAYVFEKVLVRYHEHTRRAANRPLSTRRVRDHEQRLFPPSKRCQR